jgi:hypothetical protein
VPGIKRLTFKTGKGPVRQTACLAGSSSPLSPTTHSRATGDFLNSCEMPAIGGDLYVARFAETVSLRLRGRILPFFSGSKIPFPGNGDRYL